MREPSPLALGRARRAALAVLGLGVAAFLVVGADRPADPYLIPAGTPVPARHFPGFYETGFTITPAGGTVDAANSRAHCALLAVTTRQQEQGLMGRRDLAGYDGMIFEWPAPTRTYFYMKDTVLPLSIAWFAASGRWVGAADMASCPPTTLHCPLYRPALAYQYALEVPRGGLPALGAGPGSSLGLTGPCIP